jgi:HlyD family secretion protein
MEQAMTDSNDGAAPKAGKSDRASRWFLRLGVIALVCAAAYVFGLPYLQERATPPTSTALAPVEPRQVTALGEVLPVSNRVTVAAPTGQDAGRISEIKINEGDVVQKGQVLAVLDTEPLLRALLAQAEANEAVNRVALTARSADLDADEGQLRAQVDQQRVALEKAEVELDRFTRLRDSGVYEDAALVDLRLDVQSAAYNLRNTEIQLERNQLRLSDGLRVDEASAKAELDAAIAAREKAAADYEKASIKAPIDGRILGLFGRLGQQIDTGGFAEIGDTSRMMVRAEVYESDIVGVTAGQAVTVTSRALRTELVGTVDRIGVRISEQSILSTDPAAIVDARVIEVWIKLDEASSRLTESLSGLQVLVTFAAIEGDDA